MSELKNKTIITVATTGAWPTKANNPNVPMTPEEISEDVYACWKAGAAIAHLHMRDDEGHGTMDKEKFRETIRLIRSHKDCDVIINCTSSGASPEHPATDDERMAHHRELPGIEMGSYDAGSFNWMPGGVFVNSPQFLEKLGDLYMEKGIKPELECFNPESVEDVFNVLVPAGVLEEPVSLSFVMGMDRISQGSISFSEENLDFMIKKLPKDRFVNFSTISIGAKHHVPGMAMTVLKGGGARVWKTTSTTPPESCSRATPKWWSGPCASSASWAWRSPPPTRPAKF